MRYFIELIYNGANYCGWQIQPDVNSVQEEIEKALSTVLQEKVCVVGAGRTDTGVHAAQFFAHFDCDETLNKNHTHKFNSVLPSDLVAVAVLPVNADKHARFDAISRSYEYRIWLGRNPFLLETTWQLHYRELDIEKMNKAAAMLLEYTNFQAFSKVKTDVKTFDCSVFEAIWKHNGNQLTFCITANRFLRNMVRSIVGTLIDVGTGKISVDDFREVILSRDRGNAGLSVPAKGLFLTAVKYDFI